MKSEENKYINNPNRKTCRKHLLGKWGKDHFGDWFLRCGLGNALNEDCEELIEEGGEKNE